MAAGVMQDIDIYPADSSKIDSFFDQSTDYTQTVSSVSFWDDIDRSADSSAVNSAPTSVSHQTPNTSVDSPDSSSVSHDLSSNSHKHKLTGNSLPSKRKWSETRRSRLSEDPSPLDCTDYWLGFDSDNESLDVKFENDSQTSKSVRSSRLAQPHPTARIAGRAGGVKVAYPPSTSDLVDDSALDHALSDDDDLFSMALADHLSKTESVPAPPEVPSRERLYSTPLSWEAPQPGFRMDYVNVNPPFNDPERQRLLAIAMGTGQAYQQPTIRPQAGMDFRFEINQSPTTMSDRTSNTPEPRAKAPAARPQAPSRNNSAEGVEKTKDKPKNSERAAHNDIERKYRTNLKDKIAELRDAVPSLRSIPEDGDGESPTATSRTAPKVSKGTILTKATEYIHQLERRNRSMAQKNEELARRLHAFEQLVGAAPAPNWAPQGYGQSVFNPRAFS
ncbi:HLH-domain-containing protein [Xylariaceae sp. FL0662B]|nr:HLH-domain-containing protein [Xylariaceae sp. FL0662B]